MPRIGRCVRVDGVKLLGEPLRHALGADTGVAKASGYAHEFVQVSAELLEHGPEIGELLRCFGRACGTLTLHHSTVCENTGTEVGRSSSLPLSSARIAQPVHDEGAAA